MPIQPTLASEHLHTLSLIAEDGDGVMFALEVQELAELGMIYDDDGVLRLTGLGRATLQLVEELDAKILRNDSTRT